jgi:nitroreductase
MSTPLSVSDAVLNRKSIRAFLDQPVDDQLIRDVLSKASRSPSGGNVQPWRLYVINGESHAKFRAIMDKRLDANEMGDVPEYDIYPPSLKAPYRDTRFKVGEDMYAKLDIKREDKPKRLEWLKNNQRFFGAPAALFCYVDRCMGPPQWSDLGMYLQTAMLLFQEAGIDTCAQESWARWHKSVTDFVGAPEELMMFCALAIGYKAPDAPVNSLVSDREPLEKFATFL